MKENEDYIIEENRIYLITGNKMGANVSMAEGVDIYGNIYYLFPDSDNDLLLHKEYDNNLPFFRSVRIYENVSIQVIDLDFQKYLEDIRFGGGANIVHLRGTNVKEITLPAYIEALYCSVDCRIKDLDKCFEKNPDLEIYMGLTVN